MQSSLYSSTQDILYKDPTHLTYCDASRYVGLQFGHLPLRRVLVYLLALQARLERGAIRGRGMMSCMMSCMRRATGSRHV